MCLAIPVRVETLLEDDQAIVELGETRKQISLALVDDVAEGDYVILHVGYALNKIDADEAERTLEMFMQMENSDQELKLAMETGSHEIR